MFAYLILNIQTIFKVVLGTFGYLVVFLFFFTSARDVEHKGHCWFIFIFSTKIKFNDFIEFFFQINLNAFMMFTQYTQILLYHTVVKFVILLFCIFHELFIHFSITENICDLIKNIVCIFFVFVYKRLVWKIFLGIFLAHFDEILMHTLNSSKNIAVDINQKAVLIENEGLIQRKKPWCYTF